MDFSQKISEIEEKIKYAFRDKKLLRRAFTLSSFDKDFNNQTLEFFGDAILEFIVSERIFDRDSSEGKLTDRRKAMVSDRALTPVSKKLGLDKYLIKDSGDTKNKKAVPSVYEALVAAIYLDGGIFEAKKFVLSTLDFSVLPETRNYKGELQERLAKSHPPLRYRTFDVGNPQRPEWRAEIEVCGNVYTGRSTNKKQAEQNAACEALKHIG